MIGSCQGHFSSAELSRRFAEITEPLRGKLLQRAKQLTRNPDDAEDLVQETYLRAFRFFETFHPENSIQYWMFKIQRSIFINNYRRKQWQQESLPTDRSRSSEEFDTPGLGRLHELDPREIILQEELDEEIISALDRLPESFRSILWMFSIGELSYEEIADRVTCPVGTVRSRLSRAKNILRRKLTTQAIKFGYATN